MNRAERRRLEKQKKKKDATYQVKRSDLEIIRKEVKDEALNESFALMFGLPLMVLRDKYGFGEKRLKRFVNEVAELYDSFEKDYVTFTDIINTLKEEVNLTITVKD